MNGELFPPKLSRADTENFRFSRDTRDVQRTRFHNAKDLPFANEPFLYSSCR